MEELAGDAHISFEGDSRILGLTNVPGASQIENAVLKRNTSLPRQEFVVVPLEPSSISTVFTKIGGTIPKSVLHIQIEKNGKLEFGSYDSFHPGCIVFGNAIKGTFLDSLISDGLLERLSS